MAQRPARRQLRHAQTPPGTLANGQMCSMRHSRLPGVGSLLFTWQVLDAFAGLAGPRFARLCVKSRFGH